MISDPGQHVGEPGLWIDVVQFRGLDQRQHDRGAFAAAVGASEQPCFSSESDAAQCAFGGVVGAISLLRAARRWSGDSPLIARPRVKMASNFCTAANAIGEIMAELLLRALEAASASSSSLRRACAQHPGIVPAKHGRAGLSLVLGRVPHDQLCFKKMYFVGMIFLRFLRFREARDQHVDCKRRHMIKVLSDRG